MSLENYTEEVVDNMAEEIVEEAKSTMSMDDFMSEMGIEKGEEKKESVIDLLIKDGIPINQEYRIYYLKDLYDDDLRDGKAYVSSIHNREWDNKDTGETEVRKEVYLVIVDDDNSEINIITMNINPDTITDEENEVIEKIHHKSKLFSLIKGVAYLRTGDSLAFDGDENIAKIRLDLIRNYVQSLERFFIKIVEVENGDLVYNSFVVLREKDI